MINPLLTIVMPAYNAEKYIRETIQSICDQRFTQWKLIVINDASKDNTAAVVQSFSDPRIMLVNNEQNLRVAKTMNKGIAMADTPFFARVDSDDICLPEHFQKHIDFFEKNPNIAICGNNVITIDENGNFNRNWYYETTPEMIKASAVFGCPFIQSSVVFRTDALKNLGGYKEEMELIEDYELWLRAIQKYDCANLPEMLIKYRVHSGNMSGVNKEKIMKLLEGAYLKYSKQLGTDTENLSYHARMEYGDWSNIAAKDLGKIKRWKKRLEAINNELKIYDKKIYRFVLDKYFTNAFLKIISQNGAKMKILSLLYAITLSPLHTFALFKRRMQSAKPE
jgi:glycosyltransferase involved in cell wall biosynthesis